MNAKQKSLLLTSAQFLLLCKQFSQETLYVLRERTKHLKFETGNRKLRLWYQCLPRSSSNLLLHKQYDIVDIFIAFSFHRERVSLLFLLELKKYEMNLPKNWIAKSHLCHLLYGVFIILMGFSRFLCKFNWVDSFQMETRSMGNKMFCELCLFYFNFMFYKYTIVSL